MIRNKKEKYKSKLKSIEGIESIGICLNENGEKSISIGLSDESGRNIPQYIIDDIGKEKIVFKNIGKIEYEPSIRDVEEISESEIDNTRPVPTGVSTGHYNITAGTTSFLLEDGDDVYSSSNNHIYADTNNGEIGDPIYQPGPIDGGDENNTVSTLYDYVKIEDGVTVDLAWADLVEEHVIDIPEIGKPQGKPKRPELGDEIIKHGRTTGTTIGTVEQIETSVSVDFGFDTIWFEDQFLTDSMSDGGDSGSATLNKDDKTPAGMLFAGSDSVTVHNYADNIEKQSGMKIITEETMEREKIFEATEQFETVAPDSLFFLGMELDEEAVRGEDVGYTVSIGANKDSVYYVTIYVNGEEVDDVDQIPMDDGDELSISSTLNIPNSETMDVIIEGGYER